MADELVLCEPQEKKYLVDGLPVPVSDAQTAPEADTAHSMSFNLQTSGLAVQIKTTMPNNLLVVELQAKLELALLKLAETESKFEIAMRRIGFLEAQLEAKGP